jgi:hypothetical protein
MIIFFENSLCSLYQQIPNTGIVYSWHRGDGFCFVDKLIKPEQLSYYYIFGVKDYCHLSDVKSCFEQQFQTDRGDFI